MAYYCIKTKHQVKEEGTGKISNVLLTHILEAVNLVDAETKMTAHMKDESIDEFDITSCSEYKMNLCVKDYADDDNKWFSAKICFEFENDKGKIQKTFENHLVYTSDIKKACSIIENGFKNTTLNWSIQSIQKTVIGRVDIEKIEEYKQ